MQIVYTWLKRAVLLMWVMGAGVVAAHEKKVGDYTIHYSAFNSTFLSPEIAKQYDIARSGYQGVVNISVSRLSEGQSKPERLTAEVIGKAKNQLSQQKDLSFKEVREGDAIYYLATFRYDDQENLTFQLQVKPEAKGEPQTVEFSQQFFVN